MYPSFFEFTSYYQVGFITCLEWHAKSRLFDFLSFFPALIGTDDIKQTLTNPKILGMAAEGLTVPHLLVSSSNVSTPEKYLAIFRRILEGLGTANVISDILDKKDTDGNTFGKMLSELFEERNQLVHEISLNDIGHRTNRNFKSFDEIAHIGSVTLEIIKSIETEVTKNAPPDFPNLLDNEHIQTSRINVLEKQIFDAEERISVAVKNDDFMGGFSANEWEDVVALSRSHVQTEKDFIIEMDLPGRHYFDARTHMIEALLKSRLGYLNHIMEETLYDEEDEPNEHGY